MTYPDAALAEQVLRDQTIVYLDRRALPEVLVPVLHPKGHLAAAAESAVESPMGWSSRRSRWRVVELWTVPAEQMLEAGDVGVVPWVPLARIDGPPEPVLRRCRRRIDREAAPDEVENMLAVAQVFAGLRYNDPELLQILGGRTAMIESPILKELKAEWTREGAIAGAIESKKTDIITILTVRFGPQAGQLSAALDAIDDADRLRGLIEAAVRCPTSTRSGPTSRPRPERTARPPRPSCRSR